MVNSKVARNYQITYSAVFRLRAGRSRNGCSASFSGKLFFSSPKYSQISFKTVSHSANISPTIKELISQPCAVAYLWHG
jgi:hypothetical protein